jgi:hypothetical protein
MKLTRTSTDFYIFSSDFTGEVRGEIIKIGTLAEIKAAVFEMLKSTPLASFPTAVELVETILKPSETVLLIEIESEKAYQIKPTFGNIKFSTIKKTWAGGLLNIIAFVESSIKID